MLAILRSATFRYALALISVFFLFSGQGIRYLVGLPAYAILAVAILAVSIVSFWGSFKIGQIPILISTFLGLASVTIFWTQTSLITAIALLVLWATTFLGLSLSFGLERNKLFLSIYRGLQFSLIAGLIFELFLAVFIRQPVYPFFHEWVNLIDDSAISPGVLQWSSSALFSGGPIQGFVGNRNLFGFIALLTGILAPLVRRDKLVKLSDAVITFSLAFLVHLFTGSATVTFIAVAVAVLTLAAYIIRGASQEKRRLLSWIFVSLAISAAFISYIHRDLVTLMLGREPDLTNRTEIWRAVFDTILTYPQGTGWVSYWPIWQEPYRDLVTLEGTPIAQAHNAFLDVWLQLGPLAALILLAIFTVTLISGWELVESENHGTTVRPLALVLLAVALGLQAISESRLLLEGNWLLFVIVACSVPQLISNRGHLKESRLT